jgi:NADH dehydrogenase FAD-containing subunit
VTVVGSGPTGLETAAELAEHGRAVTLVTGGVFAPSLHPRVRPKAARRLVDLKVQVIEGASVREVTRDTVRLDDGRDLPSAVTIWTAGFRLPDLAARSGLRTDEQGRLLTDRTLTSLDDEHIVAAGDAGAIVDRAIRMSCQAAGQLGPAAAATVLRRIDGKTPTRARVFFAGQCISLGRDAGLIQFANPKDEVNALRITGRRAARIKEFVCRYTVKKMAADAAKAGGRSARDHGTQRLEASA